MNPARRILALVGAVVTLLIGLIVFLPREQEKRETIRVVYVKYLSFAPLFIAYEEGFFEAEGLDVELLSVTGIYTTIPSLVQGEVDVLPAAIMPAYFNIISRGGLMKIVAGKGHNSAGGCAYSGLMVRRKLIESGEVSKPSDLAGRRVSTERIAPSYLWAEKYLQSGGLSMDDLEVIDIPIPARLGAFENGSLDLTTASEPWLTRFSRDGHSVLLARSSDILPNYQFGYLLFGKTLLEDRREAGQKFILAYLKAVRHMNSEGKTDRQIEILSKYTGLDKELLKDACWPSIRDDGRVQTSSLDIFQQWALKQDLISEITDVKVLYDSRFIEAANQLLDDNFEQN